MPISATRPSPESGGTDPGDVLGYDLAASFRVLPWVFGKFPDHQLNAMLELNGAWQRAETAREGRNPDSGGNILFVSPGLQYIYDTFLAEVSVQVPLPGATHLEGDQLSPDWAVLAGVRWLIQ